VIVRIGRPRPGSKNLGYSLDGGKTWHEPASVPDAKATEGHIAVSSNGETWAWTSRHNVPYVTTDKGVTWTACAGAPMDTRVIADRVNPKRFYGIALFEGKLFESVDGAAHFTERPLVLSDGLPKRGGNGADNRSDRGDDRGGQDRIYATRSARRSMVGCLQWPLPLKSQGLRSHAGRGRDPRLRLRQGGPQGQGCSPLSGGHRARTARFFRSTDSGATWVRINDDQHQWGLVLHITGDPKKFGRVYVGTHGRGTFYGDPASK